MWIICVSVKSGVFIRTNECSLGSCSHVKGIGTLASTMNLKENNSVCLYYGFVLITKEPFSNNGLKHLNRS